MTQQMLEELYQTASAAGSLLILPHNDPDPDAIASAVALRYLLAEQLGLESVIAYQGIIGRAENRALVRFLDHPLRLWMDAVPQQPPGLALIDAQPGAGNVSLPPGSQVILVIDHHAPRAETQSVSFADIRPAVGATSTILTQYLRAAGLEPPSSLATGLFYGIKALTMGLSRDTSPEDAAAYAYLQPRMDAGALARIEHAKVPPDYFRSFDTALRAARMYDGLLLTFVGTLAYPDLPAEMADVLLRLDRARWVVCMGVYQGVLVLSVRSRGQGKMAEELAQSMVAGEGSSGGHGTMAGGQIPLQGGAVELQIHLLKQRAFEHLGISPEAAAEPLI
jgi:nanoRNase/pAp phosphatase (c-di-AMP/oligoRNAs hydrolase)